MSSGYLDKILKKESGAASDQTSTTSADNVVVLPTPEPPPVVGRPSEKLKYEAYGLHQVKKRTAGRIRFYYSNNPVGQSPMGSMSYSYLTEIYATSDRFLSLIFTNVVVTLEGRNLFKLYELIEEDKVHWVQRYDPLRHSEPEEGAVIVTDIYRQSLAKFMAGESEKGKAKGTA